MNDLWVSRTQWLARPATKPPQRLEADLQRGLAVHHSGSKDERRQDHTQCAGVVRAIQRFHMDARGWNDIAYSWIACTHGSLFEGRGLNIRTAAQGTEEGNRDWHAVCWLGDGHRFDSRADSTQPLLRAVSMLRAAHPAATLVWPHLRFHATLCPGVALREWCRQFPD